MLSSPMKISKYNPVDDSNDMYGSSPEPTICDCHNQLGHFDWNGIPHENLPDLCKRTMGIRVENTPISPKNDEKIKFRSDDINSATDPDAEWKQVILRRASRNPLKDLIKNAGENVEGTTLTDTDSRKVGNVVEKGDAGDLTRTKGHKRRENANNTWKSKKKMAFKFRIKFPVGKKRSTVKLSVKIT